MSQKVQIVFDAKMELNNLKSGLSQFQNHLQTLSLPKNIGTELERRLDKINTEIKNFESLASKAGDSLDTKKIGSSYEKIAEQIRQLGITQGKIKDIDAKKLFPEEITNKIKSANNAIEAYNKSIKDGTEELKKQASVVADLEKAIKREKNKTASLKATRDADKNSLQRAKAKKAQVDMDSTKTINTSNSSITSLEKTNALLKEERELAQKIAIQMDSLAKAEEKRAQVMAKTTSKDSTKQNAQNAVALEQQKLEGLIQAYTKYGSVVRSVSDIDLDINKNTSQIESFQNSINNAEKAQKTMNAEVEKAESAFNRSEDAVQKNADIVSSLSQSYTEAEGKMKQLNDTAKNNAFNTLTEELKKLGITVDPTVDSLEKIEKTITDLETSSIDQVKQALEKADINLKDFGVDLDKIKQKKDAFKQSADDAMKLSNQIQNLKGQVQYFFSLTNGVQLFKRAVMSAFETVKELDKAMTETAVVTDFSVGDMWEQLPRYTQAANELGTTTKGAYETMTLFYQQGLDTNEAFAIGTETMKMARIAGLDYANATNLMTAALRGFNMELNETSATRINDVYSELAAITAADTQEIATAMTKTASIAANANMEFETTAALLSQIIETTREPAETAGTAMKTIIARFTEMKKAASDVINVDGEEVNVNKVEAALKSAGVALRDTKGEFRDLDDVFLELSSKWNGLDMMTQRYVATMAAGSRQQSRFIAMMSDYDRTLELVDAAYNSSGASQKQFEKTQDSLESKLNKLTNAWNEFLMGISNSSVIKGAVDLLTGILNIINKVTGAFGEGVGGVLKFATALGALKVGEAAFRKISNKAIQFAGQAKKGEANTKFWANGTPKEQATKGLNNFSEKLNNFNEGKGFKLNVDIEAEKAKKGLQEIGDKATETAVKTDAAMEVAEQSVSEVGTEATETSAELTGVATGAQTGATGAKPALDLTEKEIEDIKREAIEAKAALNQMNPDVDVDDFLNILDDDTLRTEKYGQKSKEEIIRKTFGGNINEQKAKNTKKATELLDTARAGADLKRTADAVDDVGDAAKKATPKAGGLGTALKGTLKAVLGFAKAHPILLAFTAAITAAAAATVVLWQNMDSQVAQREFEEASQTAENFKNALDRVTESLNNLKSSWDGLEGQDEVLGGLVEGTLEWKEALAEYNSQVLELVKNNKNLSFSVDEKGQFILEKTVDGKTLTGKEAYESEKGELQDKKTQAELNSYLADAYKDYAEFNAYATTLKESENLAAIYQDQMLNSTDPNGNLGSSIGYLWQTDRANKARESLGLSENYTEEEYNNLKQQKISQYEAAQKSAIQASLSEDYTKASSNAAATLLANFENSQKEREAVKSSMGISDNTFNDAIGFFDSNKEAYLKEWAELQGYTYSSGKITDADGKEIKVEWAGDGKVSDDPNSWVTNEQIASDLIQARTAKKVSFKAENVAKTLDRTGTDISEIYTSDWKNIEEEVLEGLSGDDDTSRNMIAKQIAGANYSTNISDLKDEQLIDYLEATTGKSIDELKTQGGTVGNIINADLKDQAIQTKTGYTKAKESLKYEDDPNKTNELADRYNDTISKLSVDSTAFLTDLQSNITAGLGDMTGSVVSEAIKTSYLDSIKNGMDEASKEAEAFRDTWSNINWQSPLSSLEQLNNNIENGSSELATMSENAKNILSDNFLSSANQFKEVMNAEDFAEVSAELQTIYETEGKITFDNIHEAAEESATLKKALDEGTISATGYAKAMEMVSEGTLDVTNVTSELLNALTKAHSLMDNMDQAYKRASEYDFGKTYTDIGASYKEASEAVQALAEGGAWGDPQFDTYMNYLVGEDEWQEALDANNGSTKAAYESLKGQVTGSQGTLLQQWQSTITDDDTTERTIASDGTVSGLAAYQSGGKVLFDLTNIKSTDDLVKNIVDNTSKTEEEARAMVADAVTYSDELARQLEFLDKQRALEELLSKKTSTDGNYRLTEAEMKALGITEADLAKMSVTTGTGSNAKKGKISKMTEAEEKNLSATMATEAKKSFSQVQGIQGQTDVSKIDTSKIDTTALQSKFNAAVNNGIANGLTLDGAKQAALDGLAQAVGDSNKNKLAAGLCAGYNDESATVAAAEAGAKQAQQLYTAIYTAIVSAIADAYGATTGISSVGAKKWDSKNKEYNADVTENGQKYRYTFDENGKALKKHKWTGDGWDKGEKVTDGTTYDSLDQFNRYQEAKTNASSTAQKTAEEQFSTVNYLAQTNNISTDEAQKMIDNVAKEALPEEVSESTTNNGDDNTVINITGNENNVDAQTGEQTEQEEDPSAYDDSGQTGVPGAEENGSSSGGEEFKPENWAAYNADQELAALDRQRAANDREAELISKLPQEIQGPLQLMNLGEDMMYEAQEIQINKNKLEALQLERSNLEAEHSGVLNSGAVYYDEQLQSYMYNNDIMQNLSTDKQKEAQEAMAALSEVSNKINEVSDQLDGGKIQAFIRAFEKGTKGVSKVLKEEKKTATNVNKAFDLLEKKLGLSEDAFDDFANGIAKTIDNSEALNATFEGLDDEGDALIDDLEKSPLGKMLGESAKPVFDLLKNGGTNRQMGGALAGLGGDMLGKLGDFANFDMLGMGLDGMNMMKGMMDQGKQMAEQAAQYICQAIQVVVDAITNREDILFNYLNLIEKELQNYEKLQRYSTQLEKGRLASSEEIALNWDAQWESLQKQLEMQEFRVEQRQQQLEMSRWIPFQLISGWDPTSDTLYENREVKFAWDLLIGFGQMLPMFGQVFGSLNQLYEDYDKRVTEAYEDRLEAEQAILDIQDERLELVKVGSEEATEFEEKILEALVQKEQEAIDELTAINDSITDANSKLLSTLQDKLDKLREQRENEKMEEELGEKERRLAYFRQNTGQGKLMDIKKLEEELEEGHESYTDQLIDQRIADLEKQNEKAAEQREKQIDLMQAQLDWSEKYGLYWDQIYGMLYVINDDGTVSMNLDNFDLEGNLRTNGELSTLLNTFSDNIGKSIWSQLLENEELMRLGRYYQAFISRNGVTGEWGKYWALLNPGQDDPSSAYVNPWDSRDVGFLLKGILAIESAINRYFILSDYGLANMAGRIEAAFKNTIGKLFGIEEWANYKFEGYRADHVNAPISEGLYDIGTAIGIYEKEPDNSTYKSYGAETSGRISKTENVKDTMYDIDLYIGEIFDSTGDAIDALTGFFANLFSTVETIL